jgi:hypothetical protein
MSICHRNVSLHDQVDVALVCQILPMLPNLHSVDFGYYCDISLNDLPSFFTSVQHAPLRHLEIGLASVRNPPPISGRAGLETFHIKWNLANYDPEEPENPAAFLYELLRPSLDTLVSLTLDIGVNSKAAELDLRLLKPAHKTLRIFSYKVMDQPDCQALQIVSDMFPHIVELSLLWSSEGDPRPIYKVGTYYIPVSALILTLAAGFVPQTSIGAPGPYSFDSWLGL